MFWRFGLLLAATKRGKSETKRTNKAIERFGQLGFQGKKWWKKKWRFQHTRSSREAVRAVEVGSVPELRCEKISNTRAAWCYYGIPQ